MQSSTLHLHPVVGEAVLHVERATELVLVRVMRDMLHFVDKANHLVQAWRFPAEVVSVCVVRTKTKEGVRKCKVFVATNNNYVWCLYFPPSWLSSPSSSEDDFLSSQAVPDPESKKRGINSTQDNKRAKKPKDELSSQPSKSNNSDSLSFKVINIKTMTLKNCVLVKETPKKIFLLGNNLIAFHSTDLDAKYVGVHTVESFNTYFDSSPLSLLSADSQFSTPLPDPSPILNSQSSFLFTPTPTPSSKKSSVDLMPAPKITTNIPSKGLTCLIMAPETSHIENALRKTLFGALFGINSATSEQVVLVWGDVSGKVYFTTTSFSSYTLLFDLKESVQNLIPSQIRNNFIIIGKMGKVVIMSVSNSGNLQFATKHLPYAPISHSSLIPSGGLLFCSRGILTCLTFPPNLADIENMKIKTLPLGGVDCMQVFHRGSAVILLRNGKFLKIKDIGSYMKMTDKGNAGDNKPPLLQPLLELISQISKSHSSLMSGKVSQQNEELIVTNRAIRVFSDIKAGIKTDKELPLSVRVALFPAPHMTPVFPRSNLILRCAVKNSLKYEFSKRFWSLSFRLSQKDYPGSFSCILSQPLEMEKGGIWTFDYPIQIKSICPINLTTFLCFKGFSGSKKNPSTGYGTGVKIASAEFDVFDLLAPFMAGDPLSSYLKPLSPSLSPFLGASRSIELINSVLRGINKKSKRIGEIPTITTSSSSLRMCFGPPFSSREPLSDISSSVPSINTLLHSLLAAGETGMAPHKVLQNTGLAIGISPFGEKITLTTVEPKTPSTLPPSTSSSPQTIGVDIQFKYPSSFPLLHHALLHRISHITSNPDFPSPISFPCLDVVAYQSKLANLQKTLHGIGDDLTVIWQKVYGQDVLLDGDDKKKKKKHNDELERLDPQEYRDNLKKLLDIVGRCVAIYEQYRAMVGNEFLL